jgi:NDP-sugar pyrophosphorylase family protein
MPSTPDAIILCGGAGLRLRSITGDAPKAMASIADRPFLELLLRQLRRNRFRRVILAVGYRKEMIRSRFGERALGLDLAYSDELFPLGTGGALRNAADMIESEVALVMNGDSYTDADLYRFGADHREAKADASVLVVPGNGRGDCGSVLVDQSGRIVKFEEKRPLRESAYVNAGIYMLSRSLLFDIPPAVQVSLEHVLFPRWLGEGYLIRASVCSGVCVDIGTPERYQGAQAALADVEIKETVPRHHSGS